MVGLAGCAAGVHALARYSNSRQVADSSDGGAGFVSSADWIPPLGWTAWVAVVAVAAALYAAAGLRAGRELR